MTDQNIDRLLTVLARLGVVELTKETAALTPAAVHAVQRALGEAAPGEPIYQIRVTLQESADPVIWRRLLVSPATTLAPNGTWTSGTRRRPGCRKCSHRPGRPWSTSTTLGDSWRHDIVLEEILTAEEGVRYPMLVDGAGACPPGTPVRTYAWCLPRPNLISGSVPTLRGESHARDRPAPAGSVRSLRCRRRPLAGRRSKKSQWSISRVK
ncbi:hypothetical protein ABZW11_30135 [Nonomuraea sp. NPDC004580]|uniref:IS1096 element passenger TnpR family protein n=1 Tax=Nonomuraea sp. NPDC004580 TaxID=3154552 RepID=UPI0033AAB392